MSEAYRKQNHRDRGQSRPALSLPSFLWVTWGIVDTTRRGQLCPLTPADSTWYREVMDNDQHDASEDAIEQLARLLVEHAEETLNQP